MGSAPPDGSPFEDALKQAVPAGMNRSERENRAEDRAGERPAFGSDETETHAGSGDESGNSPAPTGDEQPFDQFAVDEEDRFPVERPVEIAPPAAILAGLQSPEATNGEGDGSILAVDQKNSFALEGRRLSGASPSRGVLGATAPSAGDEAAQAPRTAVETRATTMPGPSDSDESIRSAANPVLESNSRKVEAGVEPGSIRTPGSTTESAATLASRTNPTPESLPGTTVTGSATSRSGAGRMVLPDGFQAVNAASARPAPERGRPASSAVSPVSSDQQAARPAAVARADAVNAAIRAARAEGQGGEVTVTTPSAAATTTVRGGMETAQGMPGQAAGLAPDQGDEGGGRTMPGVGRGLDTLARQRGGTLTMRLDPPSLGHLKLEMKMDGARVTVLMTAASDSARSLLRNNMGSLRQALEDRGFAVDRIAVETAGKSTEGAGNSRSEGRGDGNGAREGQDASSRQDAGDGRSRGRRDEASGRRAGRGDDLTRQQAANFGETLAEVAVSGN